MFNKTHLSLKNLASVLILFLVFMSCKDEVKPLEFKTTTVEMAFKADIEVELHTAKENSASAKTINNHIKKAILKTIPNPENQITIADALKDFDKEFSKFESDFPQNNQTWALAVETEMLYKSEYIISIGLSIYVDTGGAHGNDSIQFLNFNPETGALYSNKELFKDFEGFKTLAETYFLNYMKNESSNIEEFFFGKPFQIPENIGFNDTGLILLYNVYEIASYDQGYTEFVIPKEKVKPFLAIEL